MIAGLFTFLLHKSCSWGPLKLKGVLPRSRIPLENYVNDLIIWWRGEFHEIVSRHFYNFIAAHNCSGCNKRKYEFAGTYAQKIHLVYCRMVSEKNKKKYEKWYDSVIMTVEFAIFVCVPQSRWLNCNKYIFYEGIDCAHSSWQQLVRSMLIWNFNDVFHFEATDSFRTTQNTQVPN